MFVGRDVDLYFLASQRQVSGARLVLLGAPAGMGKTSLVRAFLELLPCLCLEGRSWDNRGAVSYYALRDAFQDLPSPSPLVASFLRGDPLAPDVFFPALLDSLAGGVLFLDDLHWVDAGTVEWLEYALHEGSSPLLVIGAFRSDEGVPLRRSRLGRDRVVEYALQPLSLDEVVTVAHEVMGDRFEHETAVEVFERSRGVPLIVLEELRAALDGRPSSAAWETLIASRLNQLSESDREVLCQAAVIGEQFDVPPLVAALQAETFNLTKRLETLRVQGLLVEDGEGFRFAHNRYRETLLSTMSAAMRQAYHQRLVDRASLSSLDRTYHLLGAGNSVEGVQALLEEGDRARYVMDWRDALRYYVEALWQSHPLESSVKLGIYQRIGDLQFYAADEPEIARGYYEAAFRFTTTPRERALLLCRVAETYRHTPQIVKTLEDAARLVADEDVSSWVAYRRLSLLPMKSLAERSETYEVARRVTSVPGLPRELVFYAHQTFLYLAGYAFKDREAVDDQLRLLETFPPQSFERAQFHQGLAHAYWGLGSYPEALHHAQCASGLLESLGRWYRAAEALHLEGRVHLAMGSFAATRRVMTRVMSLSLQLTPESLRWLSKTWSYDHTPQGIEWAGQLVEAYIAEQQSVNETLLEIMLHGLGIVERIYHVEGRRSEFCDQLDVFSRRLPERLGVTWYATPAPLLSPVLPASLEEFEWTPGDEKGAYEIVEGGVVFCAHPEQGFNHLNMPRLTKRVSGDFSLEATIHAGRDVIASTIRARELAREGLHAQSAVGGGGLIVIFGPGNALRLTAHVDEPGEVFFEVSRDRWRLNNGRGYISDDPLTLRLDRRGQRFSAYVKPEGGSWLSLGSAEVLWGDVEVGVYGESILDYYPSLVSRATCTLTGVGLEAKAAAAPVIEGAYPLPSPLLDPDLPMVVAHPCMKRLMQHVRHYAVSDQVVMITGETGTGKELVARALHQLGNRQGEAFIALNCSTLPSELLESELFGHTRGAFTSASDDRMGLFEAADGGVLFLDEIGEASLALQARLLRVLEDHQVRRVGTNTTQRVDVRVIVATNRDLEAMVKDGRFRQDLYYRLKGATITLPPLRERKEEIPHLVAFKLQTSISEDAMTLLESYDWPGNIRELFQELQRATTSTPPLITTKHLSIKPPKPNGSARQTILEALEKANGNKAQAAKTLGIDRTTLYRQMKKLGM